MNDQKVDLIPKLPDLMINYFNNKFKKVTQGFERPSRLNKDHHNGQ